MPTPSPKHDTVFQSDDGGTPDDWAALIVDDTGRGHTLTNGTTKGYILAASAGDFTADPEFNVTLRFNHNTADASGYIFSRQQPAGTQRHGILVGNASTTSLEFVVNNAVVGTMTMPGSFPASGGDVVVLSWSGRPNPLTTGAGDALYHEIRCWNETDGAVQGLRFNTAVISGLGTADIVFGARHASLGTQDYGGGVEDIAYSTRFHGVTETHANWITTPSAPTLTGEAPIEVPVPDVDSGFGNEDELVGPTLALTAAAARRNSLITASPLVNEICMRGAPDFQAGSPVPSRWRSSNVPNETNFFWIGQYTYYPPTGLNFNRIKVHVHVQYDDASSSLLRCYSMAAHPDSPGLRLPGEDPAPEVGYFYKGVTVSGTDGTGSTGGNWYSFDPIRIARAPGDEHTLIGFAIDPPGGAPDYRIRAVHVEPLLVDAGDPGAVDGLDFP